MKIIYKVNNKRNVVIFYKAESDGGLTVKEVWVFDAVNHLHICNTKRQLAEFFLYNGDRDDVRECINSCTRISTRADEEDFKNGRA